MTLELYSFVLSGFFFKIKSILEGFYGAGSIRNKKYLDRNTIINETVFTHEETNA
jgi:hypothetical protein